MPSVDLPRAHLYYELSAPGGDPTVLVHGSWVDHHLWDRVGSALAGALQVLVYDRRGHGESAGAPRTRPVREDAADLEALLEAIDLYPAHLVAHSYGSAVALRIAEDRPELVRSLALHEPPFFGLLEPDPALRAEGRAALEEIRRLQREVRDGRPDAAAESFVDRFSLGPGAWGRLAPGVRAGFLRYAEQWADEFDDPDALGPSLEELGRIDVPVLLTTGARSPRLLRGIVAGLGRTLRNSQVVTLPNSGHIPQVTDPDPFVGVLGMFLL